MPILFVAVVPLWWIVARFILRGLLWSLISPFLAILLAFRAIRTLFSFAPPHHRRHRRSGGGGCGHAGHRHPPGAVFRHPAGLLDQHAGRARSVACAGRTWRDT